ncbi:hypothetical protein [Sphingomonas oligophenolica]|uniref:hypothetical protein n=1 Tax=Sphingomonas oligophenolica TaxID=301154 RepID=UPI00112D5B5D|nr:hypothetical protein [Sphingomonas oligophenolica]
MTKRFPDSARLIWVDAFITFAAFENAERAGAESGLPPTTIQRRIFKLEAWLHRMLITDENPAQLSDYAYDFLDVALEISRLVDQDGLSNNMSKSRISKDGDFTIDGSLYRSDDAQRICKLLIDCRAVVPLESETDRLKRKADRTHKSLSNQLFRLNSNIRLYRFQDLSPNDHESLIKAKQQVAKVEKEIAFLDEEFGPFKRISGSDIDMSWWDANESESKKK